MRTAHLRTRRRSSALRCPRRSGGPGTVDSPAILVGHSYGGTVITAAGADERVAGLVYIAALAPDEDDTSQSQQEQFPTTDVFAHIEIAAGRVWLLRTASRASRESSPALARLGVRGSGLVAELPASGSYAQDAVFSANALLDATIERVLANGDCADAFGWNR